MTSNDVRDILSLPERQRNPSGASSSRKQRSSKPPPTAAPKPTKPKYDGMTRELFALLGDNAPSLAMSQAAGSSFRPKFKRRTGKAKRWEWTPFRNPARQDRLVLHHWAPARANPSDEPESEYRFAEFNTTSGVYSYSNDEYIQHLRDDDWTKEETDYLIELCHAYDLRFVVIHDRYDWPSGKPRSIEDLKARYYAICRRLIRSRISTDDMDARQALLSTYSFDKQREVERKKAVARLYTRTPDQLAEEEALYVEIRRIEQNEARFASEREELLRLLGGWESLPNSAPHAVAAAGSGVSGLLQSASASASDDTSGSRAKKRKTDDEPLTAKQRQELKQAHHDELHCITRFDPDAQPPSKPPYPHLVGTPSSAPPVGAGAFLRSGRVLAPRPNLAQRAAMTLAELDPPIPAKLVFPTARNFEKWEGLLGAVTSGLEMKRQLDRVQTELRIAKARLAEAVAETNKMQQQAQSQPQSATVTETHNSTTATSTTTTAT